ncbi:MAG: apolipoprotein N-acyltransferase [Elusimicrobia bacterium]|nr:apolipoprotein N-acyltransferase [Elusimicrobiota bacterium]
MPRGGRGLGPAGAAALGAALVALALPRTSWWALGWFGLVPLFLAWNAAESFAAAALAGLAAGTAYHAAVLHWIYATCRFAKMPPAVGVLALAALSAVLGLNWALTGLLGRALAARAPRLLRPFLWAVVWTAVAAAFERWTPRLAVDLMTYTQGPNLALLQAGAWGGPHLVGFLVVLVNAALAEAWLDAPSGAPGPSVVPLSAALGLTAAVWASGAWILAERRPPEGPTARVEILQPDVDQYHKWNMAYVDEILGDFDGLLAVPGSRPPSLVVWPETAIPLWTPRRTAAPEAAQWAKSLGAEQLAGIIARPEGLKGPANAVQAVAPDGSVAGVYEKRTLVPYGEYVPFRNLIPRFVIDHWLQILDSFGDMSAGAKDQPLIATPFGPTSVTICYEAMFPRWARFDASRGARLLVNVTNDGWYKDTWGPYQHFAVNAVRAIENRAYVIRSGNTGISALIDPWGEVVADLPLGTRGRLDVDVPLTNPFPGGSFYDRHGDWFGVLCLALTGLLALGAAAARAARR